MSAIKKIKRPGSGRTKGSFSFVTVTMKDLNTKFADPEMPVIISRKWAEQVGFKDIVSKPATDTIHSIEGKTPETKVPAKIVSFDD
jgi:hypothetical protein